MGKYIVLRETCHRMGEPKERIMRSESEVNVSYPYHLSSDQASPVLMILSLDEVNPEWLLENPFYVH